MSLATSFIRCVSCITCVACKRLETTLNVGCQLREDVEWAKYISNNACVVRRGGVLSLTYRISRPFNYRPRDNYHLCIVVECMACWPIVRSVPASSACIRRVFVLNIVQSLGDAIS